MHRCASDWSWTYRAAGGIVVGALASDLEGNIVGGVALDLDGAGREVVEVLVQELEAQRQSSESCAFVGELSRNAASPSASFPGRVRDCTYIVGRLGDIGESWDRHGDGCLEDRLCGWMCGGRWG